MCSHHARVAPFPTKEEIMTLTADRTPVPVSGDDFRSIMGTLCAQVAVVTTCTEAGNAHGTTVTALCSLSLEPPMVVVALDRGSRLLAAIRDSRRVGINLLAEGQDDLATHFATKAADKFRGIPWVLESGVPQVEGHAGWLAGDVRDFVDGGDHVALFCLITDVITVERRPLVFSRRRFGTHSGLLSS
jgi:flavin reductase (DIM6/NTAB) family NADH-FMN oxidoreductase RutF